MLALLKSPVVHVLCTAMFLTLCSVVSAETSPRQDEHNGQEEAEPTTDNKPASGTGTEAVEQSTPTEAPQGLTERIRVALKEATNEGLIALMRDLAGKDKSILTADNKEEAIEKFVSELPRLGADEETDKKIKEEITKLLKEEKDSKTEDLVKTVNLSAIDEVRDRNGLSKPKEDTKVAESQQEPGKNPGKAGDAGKGENLKADVENSLLEQFKKTLEDTQKAAEEDSKNAKSQLEDLQKRLGDFSGLAKNDKGDEGQASLAGGESDAGAGGGSGSGSGGGEGGAPPGGGSDLGISDKDSINDQLARATAPERGKSEKPEFKPIEKISSSNDAADSQKDNDSSESPEVAVSQPKAKPEEIPELPKQDSKNVGSLDPTVGAGPATPFEPRSLGARSALEPLQAAVGPEIPGLSSDQGIGVGVGLPGDPSLSQMAGPASAYNSAPSAPIGEVGGGVVPGQGAMPPQKYSFVRTGAKDWGEGGGAYDTAESDTGSSASNTSAPRRSGAGALDLISLSRSQRRGPERGPFSVLGDRREELKRILAK